MSTGLYAGQTLPDSGRPMLLLDCAGIAAAAGLCFGREQESADRHDTEADDAGQRMSALLFLDLDGARRAVPLDIIDRVELVDASHVRFSAGRLRLSIDNLIIPLVTVADTGKSLADHGEISVLRMADGRVEIGYAIAEALDIVAISEAIVPARVPGLIAGVFNIDGEQVEMLDVHWLFAENVDAVAATPQSPVCLLAGEQARWMDNFLRPVLESAGYRVVTSAPAKGEVAVTLAMESDKLSAPGGSPVVRLREQSESRGDAADSIYRYDRDAVLAALAERQVGWGGR